ncbi:Fc.00g061890.m01.CDS01 [Cosmosporella sp. VM-42]
MATAFAPEWTMGPSTVSTFENPSDHLVMDSLADSPSFGQQASAHAELPPPNPPFVFPARPASPSSAPSSFSRASGRRPMSAIESPSRSFGLSAENTDRFSRSALPDFSFNPGATLPPDPHSPFLLSPPISPNSPRNIPSTQRPGGHGHRRGGSEFVGGRLREGNSIAVMSTSPTKSESGFAAPTLQPPPRRGHRRGISGAISTNDLPILQPPVFDSALTRGSSAPTSPTGFDRKVDDASILSQPEPPAPTETEVVPTPQEDEAPKPSVTAPNSSPKHSPKQAKPGNKARVGFSDTLEFIPRPLSLVSSETSSTATARPGHSLSGSISSIMSATSPNGRDSPIPLSRSPTPNMSDSRPSTAGAILERVQDLPAINSSPRRRNSIPTLIHLAEASKVEPPEPSPTKSTKRWSFFNRDPSAASSPTKGHPHSSSSTDSTPKVVEPAPSSEHSSDTPIEQPVAVTTKHKKSGKKTKRKKKVKGWAGSILPKKPKESKKRSKSDVGRPPTPPTSSFDFDDEDEVPDPELLEPSMPTVTVTESPDLPQEGWKRSDEDPSYPMIDLDAALGPFNTPLPLNPEWEAAQRAAGNVGKRRLHSAQGMKGFTGPGMHYHRRAESAPDLPPFDPGRSSIHRFNSSSTMADVFEEDEEDDDNSSDSTDQQSEMSDSDGEITPPAVVPKEPLLDVQDRTSIHSSTQSVRRSSSNLSEKEQSAANSVRAERSKSSLHDSVILEEPPSIIFRTANVFSDRSDGSNSATPSPRKFSSNRDLAPVDIGPLHLPSPANVPISPYAMSHASSFPSPRSPISVDAQRICSTAPSSVTEENSFHSLLLMGEPGPEVRISVDYDIPSLTSSNSTMTRESMFVSPQPRMSQPTLREPRPVSVSSAAFGRRRSSLASLSRLISSSHGERSKLSMEVTLDNESTHKKSKSSKTKRLSRMMQFWKHDSKEDASHH